MPLAAVTHVRRPQPAAPSSGCRPARIDGSLAPSPAVRVRDSPQATTDEMDINRIRRRRSSRAGRRFASTARMSLALPSSLTWRDLAVEDLPRGRGRRRARHGRAAVVLLLPRAVPGHPLPAGGGQLLPPAVADRRSGARPRAGGVARDAETHPGSDAAPRQRPERRLAHVWRAGGTLEQFGGTGVDRRRIEPHLRHRRVAAMVEGAPRLDGPDLRPRPVHPRRVHAGAGRARPSPPISTNTWVWARS